MQDYHLKLKEIPLYEAVELMKEHQVFYSYEVGKALFKLDSDSLATAILGKARYFTPDSWLEIEKGKIFISENQRKLKIINKTIWEAMDKLIKLDGHSDLTLHLEGSYYDIRDMLEGKESE